MFEPHRAVQGRLDEQTTASRRFASSEYPLEHHLSAHGARQDASPAAMWTPRAPFDGADLRTVSASGLDSGDLRDIAGDIADLRHHTVLHASTSVDGRDESSPLGALPPNEGDPARPHPPTSRRAASGTRSGAAPADRAALPAPAVPSTALHRDSAHAAQRPSMAPGRTPQVRSRHGSHSRPRASSRSASASGAHRADVPTTPLPHRAAGTRGRTPSAHPHTPSSSRGTSLARPRGAAAALWRGDGGAASSLGHTGGPTLDHDPHTPWVRAAAPVGSLYIPTHPLLPGMVTSDVPKCGPLQRRGAFSLPGGAVGAAAAAHVEACEGDCPSFELGHCGGTSMRSPALSGTSRGAGAVGGSAQRRKPSQTRTGVRDGRLAGGTAAHRGANEHVPAQTVPWTPTRGGRAPAMFAEELLSNVASIYPRVGASQATVKVAQWPVLLTGGKEAEAFSHTDSKRPRR